MKPAATSEAAEEAAPSSPMAFDWLRYRTLQVQTSCVRTRVVDHCVDSGFAEQSRSTRFWHALQAIPVTFR